MNIMTVAATNSEFTVGGGTADGAFFAVQLAVVGLVLLFVGELIARWKREAAGREVLAVFKPVFFG